MKVFVGTEGPYPSVMDALQRLRVIFRDESFRPRMVWCPKTWNSFEVHPYHLESGKLYDTAEMVEKAIRGEYLDMESILKP